MKKLERTYSKGFIISLCAHGLLLLLLVVSIESRVRSPSMATRGEIVQASVVDAKQVSATFKRIQHKEKQEEQKKIQHLKEVAKIKQQEEEKLADIKLAKEKEKKKLEALKQEKIKEQKRLEALEAHRQEEQEQARLEKEKEERKQAAQAKAQKKAAEEAKLAAAAQAETDAVTASEHAQWLSTEVDKFDALVRQKINQSWLRPPGLPSGLFCELYARLLPDGSVIEPRVKTSSGNIAFDQAAIAALEKASPLPVPTDPHLMDEFRQFNFRFSPPEET